MELDWIKCNGDSWCDFQSVNLDHEHFDNLRGVYVIWRGGGPVVRVGQGIIRDRIADHRSDDEINAYGSLSVTWARVALEYRDGVERYLADRLGPEVGTNFPTANPIRVNLPWPGWS